MEDDAVPTENFTEVSAVRRLRRRWQVLKQALSSLPRDADVLYLGYSQAGACPLLHICMCKGHVQRQVKLCCLPEVIPEAAGWRRCFSNLAEARSISPTWPIRILILLYIKG